jgi:hypothetical protein
MAIAIENGTVGGKYEGQPLRTRLIDASQYLVSRLFYGVLGAAGVLVWLLMQLPLGSRAKATLMAVMAGCFGMFALGWRLLSEQASGSRRR